MRSCWDILEIPRTPDLATIQRARRSMIKRWHPDTTTTPENKADYTSRCVQINAAYDQAVKLASTVRIDNAASADQSAGGPQTPAPQLSYGFRFGNIPVKYRLLAMLSALVLFTFQTLVFVFMLMMLLTAIAGAVILTGIADFLFVTVVVNPVLRFISRGSLVPKHEKLVTGLAILIFNCAIALVWFAKGGVASLPAKAVAISVALSIPLWLSFQRSGEAGPSAQAGVAV